MTIFYPAIIIHQKRDLKHSFGRSVHQSRCPKMMTSFRKSSAIRRTSDNGNSRNLPEQRDLSCRLLLIVQICGRNQGCLRLFLNQNTMYKDTVINKLTFFWIGALVVLKDHHVLRHFFNFDKLNVHFKRFVFDVDF